MIENYEQVREAIARWMGWQWNPDVELWATPNGEVWQAPDPINYSGDAWALQCAMLRAGCEIEFGGDEVSEVECRVKHKGLNGYYYSDNYAEALVNAWVEAFGGEEHGSK